VVLILSLGIYQGAPIYWQLCRWYICYGDGRFRYVRRQYVYFKNPIPVRRVLFRAPGNIHFKPSNWNSNLRVKIWEKPESLIVIRLSLLISQFVFDWQKSLRSEKRANPQRFRLLISHFNWQIAVEILVFCVRQFRVHRRYLTAHIPLSPV